MSLPPPPPPPIPAPPPAAPAKTEPSKALVALAVVGGLVVVAVALVVFVGPKLSEEVGDRVTPAGRHNGVEMTLAEFEQIDNGMTLPQVEDIVGGEGALASTAGSGEFRAEVYTWDGSGSLGANALVTFQGGRVASKAQHGLG